MSRVTIFWIMALLGSPVWAVEFVPRARFVVEVDSSNPSAPAWRLVSANMSVSTAKFVFPKIVNAPLSFGEIKVTDLADDNLSVCGKNGKSRCRQAVIRLYTIGVPGAGLYNVAGGYGMPITAGMSGVTPKEVGLGETGALVVQSLKIPRRLRKLTASDFGAPMTYKIFSDFTNAGAGTYQTSLVVEYGLLR